MPSSFDGNNLFGSGPHRFIEGPRGEYVLTLARIDPFQAGSLAVGPLDTVVTVEGRLVAATETGLWSLRDAIVLLVTHPPTEGELIDQHGRSWIDMSLVNFEVLGAVERGRAFSVPYRAMFIDL